MIVHSRWLSPRLLEIGVPGDTTCFGAFWMWHMRLVWHRSVLAVFQERRLLGQDSQEAFVLIGEVCTYMYSFFIFADQAIFFWGGEKMRRGLGSMVDFGCSDLEVSYQRMRGVWNGRLEHLQRCLGRCTSTQHQVQTSEGRVEFFFPCETD